MIIFFSFFGVGREASDVNVLLAGVVSLFESACCRCQGCFLRIKAPYLEAETTRTMTIISACFGHHITLGRYIYI